MRDAAYALEDNAVFEYRDRQAFGTMCGVDSLYRQVVPLDSLRTEGVSQLQFGDFPEAYVGQGMAYALGIRVNLNSPISVYVPGAGGFRRCCRTVSTKNRIFSRRAYSRWKPKWTGNT